MQFSRSEMNIMEILWNSDEGLTIAEIRNSPLKIDSWKDTTFHVIVKGLIEKGVVYTKPNWKNRGHGRLYVPKVSPEEYYGKTIANLNVDFDVNRFVDAYTVNRLAKYRLAEIGEEDT